MKLTLEKMRKKPIKNGKIYVNKKEFEEYFDILKGVEKFPLFLLFTSINKIIDKIKTKKQLLKWEKEALKYKKIDENDKKQKQKILKKGRGIYFKGYEVIRI